MDDILKGYELEVIYETTFDEPIRMIHEDDLAEDGKISRKVPEDVEWVLEGAAEVSVEDGRMHMKNDSYHCVLWNKQEFPECFVAEWDFKHEYPQGTAIFFFAAHAENGGSIFSPGLPIRGGKFGNYTKFDKGRIMSYHTSYTATDEQGVPRESAHLKKNGGAKNNGKGNNKGISPIDGKTDRPYRVRVAKLGARIIVEIDGQISIDWTDVDENGDGFFTGGQIGFRQMRHTLEGSYGGLKVQRVKSKAGLQ